MIYDHSEDINFILTKMATSNHNFVEYEKEQHGLFLEKTERM
jgi:hypothetical protein